MTRNEALSGLQHHERELHARGVRHAAIFGSLARGEARPGSDLDILIELDPEARLDIFSYAGLKSYIAGLFEGEVDVVSRCALKPHLGSPPEQEAVYAFQAGHRCASGDPNAHRISDLVCGGIQVRSLQGGSPTVYAVIRSLEIILEATRRLPDEVKARRPRIPSQHA